MREALPALDRPLPPEVVALARRCGAGSGNQDHIVLTQTGSMRADAAHRWAPFRAWQTISLNRVGFSWRAATGPLGCVAVTDRLDPTGARLTVIALGLIMLARPAVDDALTKGELLRYLAELPLAPDAILRNAALDWEVLSATVLRVAATHCGVRAHVDFTLGPDGLVVSTFAPDRPRLEGAVAIERPWIGRFSDYRAHRGRRIPFGAEVAWVIDGAQLTCWRGAVATWEQGRAP